MVTETMKQTINLEEINRSRMARDMGVDVAHVSRILAGKRNPSLKLAMRMSKSLGITVEQFYELISSANL